MPTQGTRVRETFAKLIREARRLDHDTVMAAWEEAAQAGVSKTDPYVDLAHAILYWDWARLEGKRSHQTTADQRLKHLASLLQEAGWRLGE